MAVTVLTIAGEPVSIPETVLLGRLVAFARGSYPTLSFFTRGGGVMPQRPDPFLGKPVTLTINGTVYFTGDVAHGPDATHDDHYGWILGYQCIGLKRRLDWFPHTDSNTGTDTSRFDLQPEDPNYIASRAGRTAGQILTVCLTMTANAVAADSYGLGGYTGLPNAPTLPADTLADLAALTRIPPTPVYFQGSKLGQAIEGFLAIATANVMFHVDPVTGHFRFLNQLTFPATTFTLGKDPVEPCPLMRSVADCFQQVVTRGSPLVYGIMLDTLSGVLAAEFDHDGLTTPQAIKVWTPADYQSPMQPSGQAQASATLKNGAVSALAVTNGGYGYSPSSPPSVVFQSVDGLGSGASATAVVNTFGSVTGFTNLVGGSGYDIAPNVAVQAPYANQNSDSGVCTCPSTTQVTITSSNPGVHWPANYWDQEAGNHQGVIYLTSSVATDINQYTTRRIVANTALTPGGQSTLTLDLPLNITDYDSYVIVGLSGGASVVWRRYRITNPAIAAALANQFSYPQAFRLAAGNGATMTSFPMGSVISPSGNEISAWFTSDPTSGTILFRQPTYMLAGNQPPANVRALVAVNQGPQVAVFPTDNAGNPTYGGTSHTVEGLTKTLTLTIGAWRDPANHSVMVSYAQDVFQSVCDTHVEGPVRYLGLYTPALTPGMAVNITGDGFTTGWEEPLTSNPGFPGLPVVECELEWPQGHGANWITTLHCSSRRAALSSSMFLRPDRTGMSLTGMYQGGGLSLPVPSSSGSGLGGSLSAASSSIDPSAEGLVAEESGPGAPVAPPALEPSPAPVAPADEAEASPPTTPAVAAPESTALPPAPSPASPPAAPEVATPTSVAQMPAPPPPAADEAAPAPVTVPIPPPAQVEEPTSAIKPRAAVPVALPVVQAAKLPVPAASTRPSEATEGPSMRADQRSGLRRWFEERAAAVASAAKSAAQYVYQAGKQVAFGKYDDSAPTALGTAGQVAAGLFDVDLPADIRDLTHDVTHWKWTKGHFAETFVDALGVLPVIGVLKYGDEAAEVVGLVRKADAGVRVASSGIVRTANKSRVAFNGMEVRAVRELSHLDESTLRAMAKKGFAAGDLHGRKLGLHHLDQNPAGPVVEMPVFRNKVHNPVQHPFGNIPGAGLTAEQRSAFDAWRKTYWQARAVEELQRRGLTP